MYFSWSLIFINRRVFVTKPNRKRMEKGFGLMGIDLCDLLQFMWLMVGDCANWISFGHFFVWENFWEDFESGVTKLILRIFQKVHPIFSPR